MSAAAVVATGAVLEATFSERIDVSMLNAAVPAPISDLGASARQLRWMVAGYTLATASCVLLGGGISDDDGPRRTFLADLGAITFASAPCALAANPTALIAACLAQELSGGLMGS